MKKFLIFLMIILSLVIVLKIGVDLYLKNNFKDDVEEYLTQALDTPVSFEKLSINIFSDIEIENIKIKEPATDRLFFTVNKIYCSYRLRSLLNKKLHITELKIDNPVIDIIRYKNNRFNFEKFLNISKLPFRQKSNYLYASDSSISVKKETFDIDKFLKINKILVNDLKIIFEDEKSEKKINTNGINIEGSLNPMEFNIVGKLFFNEKINSNIKIVENKPYIKANLNDLNILNYFYLIEEFVKDIPVEIKNTDFDIDFNLDKDINNIQSNLKINVIKALISGIELNMQDQSLLYKNKDILIEDLNLSVNKSENQISDLIFDGSINNFKDVNITINGRVYDNDFMKLFDLDKQSLKTSDFNLSGTVKGNLNKNDIKAELKTNIPKLEYAFYSDDNKKMKFPAQDFNLKAIVLKDNLDIESNGKIFDGTIEVIGNVLLNKDLDLNAHFKANSLNGQEFLKENNMDKIPVYGEVFADFDLIGQRFEVSSFVGTGEIIVTKAFFNTLALNKILSKSHSNTLKKASMKDIKANIYLKDEKFSFGKINGVGDDFNFNGGGTIGMDMNMDFKLNMDILKPFITKNDLDKFLTPEDDFVLELKGTLTEPDIKTNLDDMFKEKLKEELKDKYKEDIDKFKDKAKEFFKKLF